MIPILFKLKLKGNNKMVAYDGLVFSLASRCAYQCSVVRRNAAMITAQALMQNFVESKPI